MLGYRQATASALPCGGGDVQQYHILVVPDGPSLTLSFAVMFARMARYGLQPTQLRYLSVTRNILLWHILRPGISGLQLSFGMEHGLGWSRSGLFLGRYENRNRAEKVEDGLVQT